MRMFFNSRLESSCQFRGSRMGKITSFTKRIKRTAANCDNQWCLLKKSISNTLAQLNFPMKSLTDLQIRKARNLTTSESYTNKRVILHVVDHYVINDGNNLYRKSKCVTSASTSLERKWACIIQWSIIYIYRYGVKKPCDWNIDAELHINNSIHDSDYQNNNRFINLYFKVCDTVQEIPNIYYRFSVR